jgi:hypothetical protein
MLSWWIFHHVCSCFGFVVGSTGITFKHNRSKLSSLEVGIHTELDASKGFLTSGSVRASAQAPKLISTVVNCPTRIWCKLSSPFHFYSFPSKNSNNNTTKRSTNGSLSSSSSVFNLKVEAGLGFVLNSEGTAVFCYRFPYIFLTTSFSHTEESKTSKYTLSVGVGLSASSTSLNLGYHSSRISFQFPVLLSTSWVCPV